MRSSFVLSLTLLGCLNWLAFSPQSSAPAPVDIAQNPTPGGIILDPPERPYEQPRKPLAPGPSYEEQVLEIVNQERWANGQLPPLKGVDLLDTSSETHSSNMATRDFFAHCDLDTGKSPFQRMIDAGYSYWYAGENIAVGYSTPASVMTGWMGSSGHRANILSTNFREIGVGYVNDAVDTGNVRKDDNSDCTADNFNNGPYYHYWTQNFGSRNDVYPCVINREAYETSTLNVNLYVYGQGFAQEMRFRNESGAWSGWETYNPNRSWTLSSGDGSKEVQCEIRNGVGTVRSASDTIIASGTCDNSGPTQFYTVAPCRLIDTRLPAGPLAGPALTAMSTRDFTIWGSCGIPTTAKAISVNIAVTEPTAAGNVRLFAAGDPLPLAASITYISGQTRSNNAVVPLNCSGALSVYAGQASGQVHFILDVNGYFQ